MNLTDKIKDRRVIPNWRYYENTLAAGELNGWKNSKPKDLLYSINDYVELWKGHHSLYRASDLLSAAITNGHEDDAVVREAATFILDQEKDSSRSMIQSASYILGLQSNEQSQSKMEIQRLKECTDLKDIRSFVHTIRQRLQMMPYNPFLYVDLARAYLLLGQTKKAEIAIDEAVHFGGDNRFVARSAARFYLHLQDKEHAYEVIRAKGAVSADPWLMAAEISINMLRGKTSNYIKKGCDLIDSGNCTPFGFTELASSIGTLELLSGANKKSNKLFKKALISPNDNSLAQVQWVNSFEPLSINLNVPVDNDYEVKTFTALAQGKYVDAVHEAVGWICDMPFAHKPVNIGSTICTNYLQDFTLASAILDVGLRTDDNNPFLLNNKAYCAARDNKVEEAKVAFGQLIKIPRLDESLEWKVCVPATEGLILYRSGNPFEGAEKYKVAINNAQKGKKDKEGEFLYKKAVLNYCRERLIAGNEPDEQVWADVMQIKPEEKEIEVKLLLQEVINEYKKKKNERN